MGRKRTAEEWSGIVAEYVERDCTQEEFCRRHRVNPHTLSYHLSKRLKKSAFVPAVVQKQQIPEIVLELPGGMTLRICG